MVRRGVEGGILEGEGGQRLGSSSRLEGEGGNAQKAIRQSRWECGSSRSEIGLETPGKTFRECRGIVAKR